MPLLDDVVLTKQNSALPGVDIQAVVFQRPLPSRKQSLAKTVLMNQVNGMTSEEKHNKYLEGNRLLPSQRTEDRLSAPHSSTRQSNGNGAALTDTPSNTAPSSPRM